MILTKIKNFGFYNLLIFSIFSYNASASLCGIECGNLPYKEQLFEIKKQEIIDTGIFELSFALAGGLDVIANTPFQPSCQGNAACTITVILVQVAAATMSHYDKVEREKLKQFATKGTDGLIEFTPGTLALSFDTNLFYGSTEVQEIEITVIEASDDPDIVQPGTLAVFSLFTPVDFDSTQLANIDNVISFSSFHPEVNPEPTSYTLKVSKTGTGSGIVKSNFLDIDCGSDCIEEYASIDKARIILSAFPDNGSIFRGWNGACLDTGTCTVSMYNNKHITATFAIDTPSTFTVSNLEDNGVGSLRQAVIDANDNPGDDIISFSSELTGTIRLVTGQLTITDSVTINGSGANKIAISGNNSTRIFQIKPGSTRTVNLNGLTLKEGHDKTGNGGGAIITESGTITISGCVIINNTANSGGGGGGLRKFGSGVVTIINTLIFHNSALDEFQQGDGGGIRNDKGKLTLINSTVSDNTAATGGGIASNEGILEINNCTITGNSAIHFGGGIDSNSEIVLANSLVVGNSALSENEISFFSFDGQSFISRGHNIFGEKGISGITPDLILLKSDSILVAPLNTLIEPLADNGGTTLTHLPVEGGIAIDTGDNSLIPQGITNDQRGIDFSRVKNGNVDIGAVEKGLIMPSTTVLHGETPTKDNVTKLYVATFNRAPDALGLNFWLNNSGLQLEQIAQSFFDQPETQKEYPSDSTNADFIAAVYLNLFNRASDQEGFEYWVGELDSGRIAKSVFILAVINGAQNTDALTLDNKTIVGLAFANAGLNGTTDAREIMLGVTDDEDTVTAALDAYGI